MRGFFLTICFLFPSLAALAQSPRDGQAVAIGPWLIEATYRNGKFERCGMSRTTEEGIEARLTRAGGGLTLAMTSPRWRLEQRKSYPIELAAGIVTWETKVTATINTVQVALTEPRFNEGLRLADISRNSRCRIRDPRAFGQKRGRNGAPREMLRKQQSVDRDEPVCCSKSEAVTNQSLASAIYARDPISSAVFSSNATRDKSLIISFASSMRFLVSSTAIFDKPVKFPPGRLRLATSFVRPDRGH